jgi:hypothetical protein
MYDVSNGGHLLRKYVSVNLSWWHTLKHASHTVWKKFADILWAPLWHALYPTSMFFKSNQSPQDELVHMVHVANAYRTVRADFNVLRLARTCTPNTLALLNNLHFLFEYAIPAVNLDQFIIIFLILITKYFLFSSS